jgi:membrane-associated phospholipid phosphatase
MGAFMTFAKVLAYWLACAVGVGVAVTASMLWADVPMAHAFAFNISRWDSIGRGLASPIIVSGEALVMAVLIAARLMAGPLPRLGEAVLVATATSLATFAVNDVALKFFFGMPNPADFLAGANHSFHIWQGSRQSSFPSGHMALAASWAFAFARLYRPALLPLCAALLVAATALVVGDWHFLSDVIAGTFVGATAGLAAGELWIQHNKRLGA